MYKFLLILLVIIHIIIIFINLTATLILPFTQPIWIASPLCTFIVWFTFSRHADCPLTKLENCIRRKMQMPEIGGFVGFYLLKVIKGEKKLFSLTKNSL